jgi:hypothetical protein
VGPPVVVLPVFHFQKIYLSLLEARPLLIPSGGRRPISLPVPSPLGQVREIPIVYYVLAENFSTVFVLAGYVIFGDSM